MREVMDETYIKQCDCPEIQGQWEPTDWDRVFCKTVNEIVVLSGYCTDGGAYGHETPRERSEGFYYTGSCDDISRGNFKASHIFIPTQDQLQGMIDKSPRALAWSFGCWCNPSWEYGPLPKEMLDEMREQKMVQQYAAFLKHEEYVRQFTSIQQLWLAFNMKEVHGKEWVEGKWTKREVR